jgi:hypothetical protein
LEVANKAHAETTQEKNLNKEKIKLFEAQFIQK